MLKGFKAFILKGNVVDLAIAVVIGTVFAGLVKAFVADILTPLIAAIVGKQNFEGLHFTVHHSVFLYGDLVNNAITFVSVAAAVYFFVVVPIAKLTALRHRGDEPALVPDDIALLTEIRDLLKAGSRPQTSA